MRACWTDLRSTKRPSKIGGFLHRFYRYGVKSAHANYTNTDLKSCQAIDPVIMHKLSTRSRFIHMNTIINDLLIVLQRDHVQLQAENLDGMVFDIDHTLKAVKSIERYTITLQADGNLSIKCVSSDIYGCASDVNNAFHESIFYEEGACYSKSREGGLIKFQFVTWFTSSIHKYYVSGTVFISNEGE